LLVSKNETRKEKRNKPKPSRSDENWFWEISPKMRAHFDEKRTQNSRSNASISRIACHHKKNLWSAILGSFLVEMSSHFWAHFSKWALIVGFFPKSRDLLAITKQVCCSVLLQCVIAVCYCSVLLQCVVAVCCCSVLQCVAISLETCLPSSHLLKRNEFYQCILANFAKTDKIVCQCQKCRAPCDVPYFFFWNSWVISAIIAYGWVMSLKNGSTHTWQNRLSMSKMWSAM